MISKMIVLILIIQPCQNEKLKAYSTLLDVSFISFIKDLHLQKRGIRIHTTSTAYQFYHNVKLIFRQHSNISHCTR